MFIPALRQRTLICLHMSVIPMLLTLKENYKNVLKNCNGKNMKEESKYVKRLRRFAVSRSCLDIMRII